MKSPTSRCVLASFLAIFAAPAIAQSWLPSSPFPSWGATPPATIVSITFDTALSSLANGGRLFTAIQNLTPGQGLAIGPGTWSISPRLDLHGIGTPQNPIWLFAANPAQRPVITRPNAAQNAVNIGSNAPARYWVLRDLEITGGSDLVRLYDCAHVWIDRCFLHDGLGVGIAAMTVDSDHLWLTRNEIARPGPGTNGEALYLGGNFGSPTVSWSVIAFNHVHDTRSAVAGQGDGIELKQGSHHNWVLGNRVHDCKNPCILVYGTGGNGENVVDSNVCYDSDDVVLQVQGEAIVRNNLALGGGYAFSSHDHQGQSRDLRVVHNTFVNQGPAASLSSWHGRPGMVFANNAAYSLGGTAVSFGNGSGGVQIAGNVVVGNVVNMNGGYVLGAGLQDFADVTLSTFHLDARPDVAGRIDNRGNVAFAVSHDASGAVRALPVDPGAYTNAVTLQSSTAQVALASGGSQQLTFAAPPLAGSTYHVLGSMSGTTPGLAVAPFTLPLNFDGWLHTTLYQPNVGVLHNTRGVVGPGGGATATLVFPPLPATLHGVAFDHVLVTTQGSAITFVSNPVRVTLQ
jgi:hypothetical protein